MATGTWRLAASITQYRAEVNARWPKRDKRSDGTIGDAAHAARNSDHDPWLKVAGVGVVRAIDIDKDLTGPATDPAPAEQATDAEWLAEHVRALGKAGDPRLAGGGYVIWRQRIASEVGGWTWRAYSGLNAHRHHVHVSVTRNAPALDSAAPWGITASARPDAVTQAAPVPTTPGGFLTMLNDAEQRELLDGVRDCRRELTQRLGSRVPGSTTTDTLLGWAINADAAASATSTKLDRVVQALLDTQLDDVMTLRDGAISSDSVSVGYLLRRAAEASVVRQRGESTTKGGTP